MREALLSMLLINSSSFCALHDLTKPFHFEKRFSIGFKKGEYGGKKIANDQLFITIDESLWFDGTEDCPL
jgi:hypothetical protein